MNKSPQRVTTRGLVT